MAAELFRENLIRGRGIFCHALLTSNTGHEGLARVAAAAAAVVNSKLPAVGELLVTRLSLSLQKCLVKMDRRRLDPLVRFLGQLVNQSVCSDLCALQVLAILLDRPSSDSVEVAVLLATECGARLSGN